MEKTQDAHSSLYANYKKVLKGAVDGQVVTRFPPEPSGFLHIGHVKAAMLNYHYAKIYNGKMLLRFDDTNPMNEKVEFVESIQKDLKTLDIHPDSVSHTSDHFPKIIDFMKKAITEGIAYAACETGEVMKEQRDNGLESEYRVKNTVADNLRIFGEMLEGKTEKWEQGKNWCIRGKCNMQNKRKCLRDPVFFRMKKDIPHHRHGTTYKAYPTYDFACPIVDSIEGVTHCLRTSEYNDRNEGYHWLQEKLGLRKVEITDFSKMQFIHTELSKRKLRYFVEKGICDGWEDPRFPTVQGIMRHGMTPMALTKFMLENGASKKTVLMEWDKIWAVNKDVIDPSVFRYTAIRKDTSCKLTLSNGPKGLTFETHPLVQKKPELGNKTVQYGKNLLVENDDAKDLEVGEKVTLLKWGNIVITGKKEGKDGKLSLTGELKPEDKDFKKTKKLTWIAEDPNTNVEIEIWELGHIIAKRVVEEGDDITQILNPNSKVTYKALAEGNIRSVQKGQRIQFERRGYFIIDQQEHVGKQLTCIMIPDGKSKNMSNVKSQIDAKDLAKGAAGGKKDKAAKGDAPAEEGGEKKPLSKKELNKLAKKEKKTGMKVDNKVEGGAPAKASAETTGAKKSSGVKAAKEMNYGSQNQEAAANFNFCESALTVNQFMNGNQLTQMDKEHFDKLTKNASQLSPLAHPHTFSWYAFLFKFSDQVRATWPAAVAAAPSKEGKGKGKGKGKKEEKKADEDEMDLFGSDDDDGEAAKKAAEAAKASKKKVKKPVIAMSLVMLEVKPVDDQTNLDDLAQRLYKNITQEGLFWKTEYKKEPVAFGIFKLIVGFSLEDEKVSVDDVVERIEELSDAVQSVEIAVFNKI